MKKIIVLLLCLLCILFISACNKNNYNNKEKNEYKNVYQLLYNDTKYENDKVYRTIDSTDVHFGKYIINKDDSSLTFVSLTETVFLADVKIKIYFPKKISDKYYFEYEGYVTHITSDDLFIKREYTEEDLVIVKGDIPNTVNMKSKASDLIINYKNELADKNQDNLKDACFFILRALEVFNYELNNNGSSLYSIGFRNWKESRILDDNAFYYEEKEDKIYITGFKASDYGKYRDSLIFPSKINNKDVVYVGLNNNNNEDEDYFIKNVQIIKISDGIEGINEYGFSNCTSLNEIHIPTSLKAIKTLAFNNCKYLGYIIIPSDVIEMGYDVFHDCRTVIYCQIDEQPDSWDKNWNLNECEVIWGYR